MQHDLTVAGRSSSLKPRHGGRSTRAASVLFLAGLLSTPLAGETKGDEAVDLKNFDRPTTIDNRWLPKKPGTRLVYEGTTVEDDGKVVPHRIEMNITDLTKVISGVRTLISYDVDHRDGELVEAELAFYAQDNDGTVWLFGEYPEEYEKGKLVEAPTWIHGLEGARAGIMMLAKPRLGTPSYPQGWGPKVDWTDRGQVEQVGRKITVPAGAYTDVVVIAETSESEPGAKQLKHYAPGVGNVRVDWAGADPKKEKLELIKVEQLSAEAMGQIRAKALELERSGFRNSRDVYARTRPIEALPGTPMVAASHAQGLMSASADAGGVPSKAARAVPEEELKRIAVKAVPGKPVDVQIERKLGADRYVVEVLAAPDGAEVDVIIDMKTLKVLGIER